MEIQGSDEKAMKTPEISGKMLRARHSRLAHADSTAIKRMLVIKEDIGLDKMYLRPTMSYSPNVDGMIHSTAITSRKTLKTRPRAVLRTHIAE